MHSQRTSEHCDSLTEASGPGVPSDWISSSDHVHRRRPRGHSIQGRELHRDSRASTHRLAWPSDLHPCDSLAFSKAIRMASSKLREGRDSREAPILRGGECPSASRLAPTDQRLSPLISLVVQPGVDRCAVQSDSTRLLRTRLTPSVVPSLRSPRHWPFLLHRVFVAGLVAALPLRDRSMTTATSGRTTTSSAALSRSRFTSTTDSPRLPEVARANFCYGLSHILQIYGEECPTGCHTRV